MRLITLTRGKFALVDDADYDNLCQHVWHAVKRKHTFHAARRLGKEENYQYVYMHRVILAAKEKEEVDHRDGNGLNNQRDNLRCCSKAQNGMAFRTKTRGASRFRGVRWHKAGRKWSAQLGHNGHQFYLGLFAEEEQAARAYDTKAKQVFGKFAQLNFAN